MVRNSFSKLSDEQIRAIDLPDHLMGLLLSAFQYSELNGFIYVPTETFQEITDYISEYVVLMDQTDVEWSNVGADELVQRLRQGHQADLELVSRLLGIAKACAQSKARIPGQNTGAGAPAEQAEDSLEAQRKAVLARHAELKKKAEALQAEMAANLSFFKGKDVVIKHSRGNFDACVVAVSPRHDQITVRNLDTDKRSTRSLHELQTLIEDEDAQP